MSVKLLGASFDLHLGGGTSYFPITKTRLPKAKARACSRRRVFL